MLKAEVAGQGTYRSTYQTGWQNTKGGAYKMISYFIRYLLRAFLLSQIEQMTLFNSCFLPL
jgi:hypothetical protein